MIEIVKAAALVGAEKRTGHAVRLTYRPPFEDMFETLTHAVVFEDKAEAERLGRRISQAMSAAFPYPLKPITPEHWLWSPSRATPIGFMQARPTAAPTWRPRQAAASAAPPTRKA